MDRITDAEDEAHSVISNTAGCGLLEGEPPALVPPGIYSLRYTHHETKSIFRSAKLYLWFEVLDYGAYFGMKLPRYYGLRRLLGKAGRSGRFSIGWKSDFYREYVTLFGRLPRLDRLPLSRFESVVVRARVRTVTSGHDQRQLRAELSYSVIDELLEVSDGAGGTLSPVPTPLPPPTPT